MFVLVGFVVSTSIIVTVIYGDTKHKLVKNG
jgi:hypothetical protein